MGGGVLFIWGVSCQPPFHQFRLISQENPTIMFFAQPPCNEIRDWGNSTGSPFVIFYFFIFFCVLFRYVIAMWCGLAKGKTNHFSLSSVRSSTKPEFRPCARR